MTSVLESLGMVHGWLIAQQAPPEIMQALAGIREGLGLPSAGTSLEEFLERLRMNPPKTWESTFCDPENPLWQPTPETTSERSEPSAATCSCIDGAYGCCEACSPELPDGWIQRNLEEAREVCASPHPSVTHEGGSHARTKADQTQLQKDG